MGVLRGGRGPDHLIMGDYRWDMGDVERGQMGHGGTEGGEGS